MDLEQKEQAYLEHIASDDERGSNVDGCFYCGGNHPSDCCTSDDHDQYWEANPQ